MNVELLFYFYPIGMNEMTLAEVNKQHPFECILTEEEMKEMVSDRCIHGKYVCTY